LLNLNPDIQIQNKSIESLIKVFQSKKNVGIVSPQLVFPNGKVQHSCRRFPTYWNIFTEITFLRNLQPKSKLLNGWKMGDFYHNKEMSVDQTAGAAFLIKKKLFNELNGLDESFPMFFSDVDMCKRVKNLNLKIIYTIKSKMIHVGGSSILGYRTLLIISSSISLIKFFFKHYSSIIYLIPNLFFSLILLPIVLLRVLKNLIFPRKILQRKTL